MYYIDNGTVFNSWDKEQRFVTVVKIIVFLQLSKLSFHMLNCINRYEVCHVM